MLILNQVIEVYWQGYFFLYLEFREKLFFLQSSHLNMYLGLKLNGVRQIDGFSQKTKSRY